MTSEPSFSVAFVLELQRKAGNQATLRLIGSRAAREVSGVPAPASISDAGPVAPPNDGMIRRSWSALRRLFKSADSPSSES